jgi:hypothetical protein
MTAQNPAAEAARLAAQEFVREQAGFAQLTTLDRYGYPVARTMTAFLEPGWSVALVQRRTHTRLAQLRRDPRVLAAWVGDPAPGATNERPHVFDIGRLPPRAVFVRGTARFMSDDWTVEWYSRQVEQQRARGFTRAPLRTPEQVVADLVGVRIEPFRVRLEGFGDGAQSFDWVVAPLPDPPPGTATIGEQ